MAAGAFQASRVDVECVGDGKPSFWFPPEVGVIKAASPGFEKELKSITPAKE